MRVEPTHRERASAAAMHGLSLFAPFLGPAAFYLVHRKRSEFVAAHSLHALYEAILLKLFLLVALICSGCYSIYRIYTLYQNDWQGFSWQEFLFRFLIGWIAVTVFGLIAGAITIMQAVHAYRGRWPRGRRTLGD